MSPARARLKQRAERGVALLLVIISITILTVVATEFAYNSRVDLQLAANQRDEIRADFLARSGIGLARLLLRFQKQIDQVKIPNLGDLMKQFGGGGGGTTPPVPGAAPPSPLGGAAGGSSMSIQLWKMAKIDCYMLQSLVPPQGDGKDVQVKSEPKFGFDEENPEVGQKQAMRSFGGFEGCFNAVISDEEEKINLRQFDAPQSVSRAAVMRALDLFSDKRFEFLFEREDSNKVKVTPQELVIAIADWIDADETQSSLNLTLQGEPLIKGFSDENYHYDKFTPRYKAKNARFDSLDELYMVHGVNDRFMAAFKDRLTVYPDINSKLNVNTDDPMMILMAVLAVSDPARPDPRLRSDPVFVDGLIKAIRTGRMFPILGMSVLQFASLVESFGVKINPSLQNTPPEKQVLGDKSTTFKIRSTGEAGAVKKTLTAVIRLDDGLGKLVYWREE